MSDVTMRTRLRTCPLPAGGLLLLLALPTLAAPRMRFMHNPAPSPDGKLIAFDWCDDIWVVASAGGAPTRLTSHPAGDTGPSFSPDGTRIAFTSTRGGNADVWVMPAGGGEPTRLTYHAESDVVNQWTPDGSGVMFASRRWGHPVDGMRLEFIVPAAGGTPYRVQKSLGSNGSLSPDGTKLAYVRYGAGNTRRGYLGPANGEIYVHDLLLDRYMRLTDDEVADEAPLWSADGQSLYFVSERDGARRNLYRMTATGGAPTALTRHSEQVKAPSISRDGRLIAYECDYDVWLFDTRSGDMRVLEVTPPTDFLEAQTIYQRVTSGATDYAVAPSGREVAMVVRGDIYVARFPEGGPTAQLTDTPEEESGVTWTPDSKSLWFTSDKEGQTDLYQVTSGDPAEPRLRHTTNLVITRKTNTPQNESGVTYSPNNEKLLYYRGAGQVVVANADLSNPKVVIDHWHWPQVSWSPDGKWLSYSVLDATYNSDVWIVPSDGGKGYNVSRHPLHDSNPVWTGDGRALAFLSGRSNDQSDVYYVWLRRADAEETAAQRADEEDDAFDRPRRQNSENVDDEQFGGPGGGRRGGGPPGGGGGGRPPAEDQPVTVEIDFDGLADRLEQLTRTIDNEGSLAAAPRGDQLAYSRVAGGTRELVLRSLRSGGERPIAGSGAAGGVAFMPDGRRITYLSGGVVNSAPTNNLRPEAVSFSAQINRDMAAERAYIFGAAWRVMKDNFYDPEFHGVDWDAMRTKYAPLAAQAPSRADFNAVVNEMLGELNSSHQGFSGGPGGQPGAPSPPPAAELGVVFTDDRGGPGLLVESVVPGSPAARLATRIDPGERILAVDGTPLEPGVNLYELLVNKAGVFVELEVMAITGGRRTVRLQPISSGQLGGLAYDAWVAATQAQVDKLSGGRLGWVHIPGMNQTGVEIFIRNLVAAGADKDGLLVDVRWNGGGSTADIILNMLGWRPHAVAVPRDGEPGYPMTERLVLPPWPGAAALLCNYNSISNAEILAHAFQVLGRGPLIGTPTFGGVISTGGVRLLDGSSIRTPGRGWYRADNGVNQENHPAVPEVIVWISPEDEVAGRDPQIEAAVRTLLAQLD